VYGVPRFPKVIGEIPANMKVWRIIIKPDSKKDVDATKFCIDSEIIGIGWGVYSVPATREEYFEAAKKIPAYKKSKSWKEATTTFLNRMNPGDLVWTRDKASRYYLGRIKDENSGGDWKYCNEQRNKDADVLNIRGCKWYEIGEQDAVPGAVLNLKRGTIKQVSDETAIFYSMLRFNEFSKDKGQKIKLEKIEYLDIFSLLSDRDLEDVIGLYLQTENNLLVYPSTCKIDTKLTEFIMVSREQGQKAFLQVKSGSASIDLNTDVYKEIDDPFYFFCVSQKYLGIKKNNFNLLQKENIRQFIFANKMIMPDIIKYWMHFIESQEKLTCKTHGK
jgi:hypothetical protein